MREYGAPQRVAYNSHSMGPHSQPAQTLARDVSTTLSRLKTPASDCTSKSSDLFLSHNLAVP